MIWMDIVSIVFVCVTMNHLELIGKIEEIIGKSIPILNCPKCSSFWFTLAYMIGKIGSEEIPSIPMMLAISFLSSYAASWMELLEGYIDTLFLRFYGKITANHQDDTVAPDADSGNSDSTMS